LQVALEQRLVGVLAVDVHQLLAQFAQALHRCRLAVDIAAGAAVGAHRAAQDALAVEVEFPLFQPLTHGGQSADLEGGADLGAVAAGAHGAAVGAIAQYQAQGVEQDGFAGAGFAGEHGHAGDELQFQVFDQGEIADGEVLEHGSGELVRK